MKFYIESYGEADTGSLKEKGQVSGVFQRAIKKSVTLPNGGIHHISVSTRTFGDGPAIFSVDAPEGTEGQIFASIKDAGFELRQDSQGYRYKDAYAATYSLVGR